MVSIIIMVHYINVHLPLFFDVVYTITHCLQTNYDDDVVTNTNIMMVLSMLLDSMFVPNVVSISVSFTELYKLTCLSLIVLVLYCLPTNNIVRIL